MEVGYESAWTSLAAYSYSELDCRSSCFSVALRRAEDARSAGQRTVPRICREIRQGGTRELGATAIEIAVYGRQTMPADDGRSGLLRLLSVRPPVPVQRFPLQLSRRNNETRDICSRPLSSLSLIF